MTRSRREGQEEAAGWQNPSTGPSLSRGMETPKLCPFNRDAAGVSVVSGSQRLCCKSPSEVGRGSSPTGRLCLRPAVPGVPRGHCCARGVRGPPGPLEFGAGWAWGPPQREGAGFDACWSPAGLPSAPWPSLLPQAPLRTGFLGGRQRAVSGWRAPREPAVPGGWTSVPRAACSSALPVEARPWPPWDRHVLLGWSPVSIQDGDARGVGCA